MDQKGCIVFESKKEDRVYSFSMPFGARLGEAYDAAFEVLQEIVRQSQVEAEKAKRAQQEDAPQS